MQSGKSGLCENIYIDMIMYTYNPVDITSYISIIKNRCISNRNCCYILNSITKETTV